MQPFDQRELDRIRREMKEMLKDKKNFDEEEYKRKSGQWKEMLLRKYFRFLVEEYGFSYDPEAEFQFQNPKMLIQISLGRQTPYIFFLRRGDDPKFMMNIESVIEFLEGEIPYRNFLKYELEENVAYDAELFRRYADRLINDFDEWWLPVQLFLYKKIENDPFYAPGAYRYLYEYLKRHGMIE